MEDEVKVAADVDTKEILRKALNVVYQLWLEGKILGETLEKASKIKEHQGLFEHEVSCGGEADFLRHDKRCKKNPGHSQFIPVRDFKIEHLPPSHRDNDIFNWIRAEADLTCRLLVKCTSANRPKYHPTRTHLLYPFAQLRDRDFMRTGTGRLGFVKKYTEKDDSICECDECSRPGSHIPHKVWAKINIMTAAHVVFDDDEATRTTCYFGYDTIRTLLHKCLKLTGLRFEQSNVVGDWCQMTYVTHDMDIVDKLFKMYLHRHNLLQKLHEKDFYNNKSTGVSGPCPVVIISHPHGRSKYVTVGMWTDRETCSEIYKHKGEGWDADMVFTSYTYNAHTCPGSSGALVIKLPENGNWWTFSYHFHSEAGQGNTNDNKSVVTEELVSFPTPRVGVTRQQGTATYLGERKL